jgi:hypothetical protein
MEQINLKLTEKLIVIEQRPNSSIQIHGPHMIPQLFRMRCLLVAPFCPLEMLTRSPSMCGIGRVRVATESIIARFRFELMAGDEFEDHEAKAEPRRKCRRCGGERFGHRSSLVNGVASSGLAVAVIGKIVI